MAMRRAAPTVSSIRMYLDCFNGYGEKVQERNMGKYKENTGVAGAGCKNPLRPVHTGPEGMNRYIFFDSNSDNMGAFLSASERMICSMGSFKPISGSRQLIFPAWPPSKDPLMPKSWIV